MGVFKSRSLVAMSTPERYRFQLHNPPAQIGPAMTRRNISRNHGPPISRQDFDWARAGEMEDRSVLSSARPEFPGWRDRAVDLRL